MTCRTITLAALAIAVALFLAGCACPYGTCTTDAHGEGRGDTRNDTRPAGEVTTIRQNLTRAEILVGEVTLAGDTGYVLRGKVVSASSVGGAESIVEIGQSVSLSPYFPTGSPDLSKDDHRRMMNLASIPPGGTIRCNIALDARGGWWIVSAE